MAADVALNGGLVRDEAGVACPSRRFCLSVAIASTGSDELRDADQPASRGATYQQAAPDRLRILGDQPLLPLEPYATLVLDRVAPFLGSASGDAAVETPLA